MVMDMTKINTTMKMEIMERSVFFIDNRAVFIFLVFLRTLSEDKPIGKE